MQLATMPRRAALLQLVVCTQRLHMNEAQGAEHAACSKLSMSTASAAGMSTLLWNRVSCLPGSAAHLGQKCTNRAEKSALREADERVALLARHTADSRSLKMR